MNVARVYRLFVCLMLSPLMWQSIALAQQTNTIYKQMMANIGNTGTVVQYSNNVPAIGQSQHTIYLQAVHNPSGLPCITTTNQMQVRLEGSYNNINYFPLSAGYYSGVIGATAPGLTPGSPALFITGLAPYVRVAVLDSTGLGTNCLLNVYYAGSLYPVFADKMEYTLRASGTTFATLNASTIGAYTVVTADMSGAGRQIVLYSVNCTSQSPQVITVDGIPVYMGTNDHWVWTATGIPVYSLTGPLVVNLTANTQVTCFLTYRYE